MSSETSTESESLQPWQLFTLAGLVGATIVVFVSRGQTPAAVVLLSLTIFTAAGVGVAAWRTFAPFTSKDDLSAPVMLGGRTRAVLERDKALALRSIKELEFDRSMGKVSEKDFADMSARLRARATRLMRQLDAGTGYRDMIENEIAKRVGASVGPQGPASVRRAGPFSGPAGIAGPADQDGASVQAAEGVAICGACSTPNDGDARFCKSCGTSLASHA